MGCFSCEGGDTLPQSCTLKQKHVEPSVSQMLSNIDIHRQTDIVLFIDIKDIFQSTLIVTEYLEGGELFDRVCDEETIPEAQCCNYVR